MTTMDGKATAARATVRIPTASGDELDAWLYLPEGDGRGWGVSPGRQQAIACALQGLLPGGGRLSPARLQAITGVLAAQRDLWEDLVVHDPDVRWTCHCTGRTAATCGCWPGNVARTPIGMTMAGRLARSPWRRAAW